MDKLNVDQLKQLAKDHEIKGRSKLRRKRFAFTEELRKIPELVEMYDNNETEAETLETQQLYLIQKHAHQGNHHQEEKHHRQSQNQQE